MKNIKILFLLLITFNSIGQELNIPTYTQYLGDNPYVISPTYAGIGDNVKIRLNGLTQWVGIKNAPDNQSLAVDARLGQRSGIGMFLYNDKNGYTYQKGGKLSFAHHLILDYYDGQYLSFGMSFVMNKFEIDITQFDNFDPIVTDNRQLNNANIDLGLLYRKNKFSISANVFNLLEKNTDKFVIKSEPNVLRNYSLYSSYRIKRDRNSSLELEPSVFYQYFESDKRSSTDINLKARFLDYEDYFWAGISYRFLNDQLMKPLNIGPMAGFKKNNLYFAYSYQVTTNSIIGYNSGTHMITLGYDIFQGLSNCPCTSVELD